MANWTPGGFIGQMFKTISKYIAPSGMPSPLLWGDETTVRDRFREGIAGLQCATRFYPFEYPFPPVAVVELFRTTYGPMVRAFESLDEKGQEEMRGELVSLWSAHNEAGGMPRKSRQSTSRLLRPAVEEQRQRALPAETVAAVLILGRLQDARECRGRRRRGAGRVGPNGVGTRTHHLGQGVAHHGGDPVVS